MREAGNLEIPRESERGAAGTCIRLPEGYTAFAGYAWEENENGTMAVPENR